MGKSLRFIRYKHEFVKHVALFSGWLLHPLLLISGLTKYVTAGHFLQELARLGLTVCSFIPQSPILSCLASPLHSSGWDMLFSSNCPFCERFWVLMDSTVPAWGSRKTTLPIPQELGAKEKIRSWFFISGQKYFIGHSCFCLIWSILPEFLVWPKVGIPVRKFWRTNFVCPFGSKFRKRYKYIKALSKNLSH